MPRIRAEGWQHAKLTGHQNEQLIAELTKNDKLTQQRLLSCANLSEAFIEKVEYGGLCETNVECILGGKT